MSDFKISTCNLAVQVPYCVVSQVSIQNSQRGSRKVGQGNHNKALWVEKAGDSGNEYPRRPHTCDTINSTGIRSIRGSRFFKGKCAIKMFDKHLKLKKRYWGRHFWAKGYCMSTVGLNEEEIRKYVRWQLEKDKRIDQLKLWQ